MSGGTRYKKAAIAGFFNSLGAIIGNSGGSAFLRYINTFTNSIGFNNIDPDVDNVVTLREARFDSNVNNNFITDKNSDFILYGDSSYYVLDLDNGNFNSGYHYGTPLEAWQGAGGAGGGASGIGGETAMVVRVDGTTGRNQTQISMGSNQAQILYAKQNTGLGYTLSFGDITPTVPPVLLSTNTGTVNANVYNSVGIGNVTVDKTDYLFTPNLEVQGGFSRYNSTPTLSNDLDMTTVGYVRSIGRVKTFHTLVDGATVTWDIDLGGNAVVTLAGNRTLAISNIENGDGGTLKIIQDGTGSRTITLPANSKVIDGGIGAVTLTTIAGGIDILSFVYDGTDYLWNYGKNFS